MSKTTLDAPSTKDKSEDDEAVNFLIKTMFPPEKVAARSSAPASNPMPLLAVGVTLKLLYVSLERAINYPLCHRV